MDEIIKLYMAGIDWTLIRENLQRTPEERLKNLIQLQRFAEELKKAGRKLQDRHTDG